MTNKNKPLKSIIVKLDVIISFILLLFISAMVIIHVFFRLIGHPLYGAEELERFLFVSMVYLSLAFITREDNQIRFDSLFMKMPEKLRSIIDSLINILCFIVFSITTYSGIVSVLGNMQTKTASLGLPFIVISGPVVLGFFLITITYLFKSIESIKKITISNL